MIEQIVTNLNDDLRDQERSEWDLTKLFKCQVIRFIVLLLSHVRVKCFIKSEIALQSVGHTCA